MQPEVNNYHLRNRNSTYFSMNNIFRTARLTFFGILAMLSYELFAQGTGIPAKDWGIGFGNSTRFSGLRFNAIDHDIDKIRGINFTSWFAKPFEDQSGTFSGLGIGVPLAVGTENRYGASFALLGVAATEKLYGLNIAGAAVGGDKVAGFNIAGLAVGGGEYVKGINIAGLAVGAGENLAGINLAGLAVGSGQDVTGFNFGGLAVGAGNDVKGVNLSVLAVGAGNNVSGINIAGLVVGSGNNLVGLNIGGLAVGSGSNVIGLSVSVLAVGSGSTLAGINIAGLAVGAPTVRGLSIALAAGGTDVQVLTIAPGYFTVRSEIGDENAVMKGLSISIFNHIRGDQKGLTIGVYNSTWKLKGLQIGLINYNRSNPKGLRVLPIFNANFRKKSSG